MLTKNLKNGYKVTIIFSNMQKNRTKSLKNLHNSKKSSTFAPAFTSEVTYDDFIAPAIRIVDVLPPLRLKRRFNR
jgi:hypothetical protein